MPKHPEVTSVLGVEDGFPVAQSRNHRAMPDRELKSIAEREVYLFGSRVRGDHRLDSDIDLRIFVDELELDAQTMTWWMHQNQTECAELKSQLPRYALHIHSRPEVFDVHIKAARASPKLKIGKVACVCIPPKP